MSAIDDKPLDAGEGAAQPAPLAGPPPRELESTEPAERIALRLFARTDVGQIREHNEDNFLVADLTRRVRGVLDANRSTELGAHGVLLAVCDGMGGAAAGEVASQMAVDILFEKMIEGIADDRPASREELGRRLVTAVEVAGLRIFDEARADRSRRGMGTTVTAAALVDNTLFLAQVGDSRAYVLRGNDLVQVTRDQSLVNQLIEAGQLTEEEAETFEHNNIILQALGTADSVQVDLTYVELQRGDLLLLCSDGLSGMIRNDEIREVLRMGDEPHDLCRVLIDRANQAGGHDNVTAIVARFDGQALPAPDEHTPKLAYRKFQLPEEERGSARPAEGTGPSHEPASLFDDSQASLPGVDGDEGDDVADLQIPGTYVPPWLVLLLVLGVVALLVGGAYVLLR